MRTDRSIRWSTKIVAALLAYVTTATSVWAVAPPAEQAPDLFTHWTSVAPARSDLQKRMEANLEERDRALRTASRELQTHAAQPGSTESGRNYFNNFASLRMPSAAAYMSGGSGQAASALFYGPQQFVRTTGPKNVYTVTINLPAWVSSSDTMHIQNGDTNGCNRVSSATITVNGTQIAGQSDFNQQVASLDRSVTLKATNTMVVTLASKPGSYLTISISGTPLDHTAPRVTIASPGAYTNSTTPYFDIHYQDVAGSGEPAPSGINSATFKATVDGVDRTSLFTVRSDEATATFPSNLALSVGAHTLVATVQDVAGNTGTATLSFTVDLTAPAIQFTQPVAGSYLGKQTPTVTLVYSDNAALNLSSLQVLVNGKNATSLFTVTSTGASATLTGSSLLPAGANEISASIQDQAGNPSSASVAFNVDIQPPSIKIVQPAANAILGSGTVSFDVQYSDDQAVNPSSLTVMVDGSPLSLSAGATDATGAATLGNGPHSITATISDKAGNSNTASGSFGVDASTPSIHVITPANGTLLNQASPAVEVDYSDPYIDSSTFKVLINGVDRTSLFTITPTKATANLAGQLTLPDGSGNKITAQISNAAKATGQDASTFTVDTIPPQVQFLAPASLVNSGSPAATVNFSDATSGVDPSSVKITLDGTDVTSEFAITAASATGVLGGTARLGDGSHSLQVTVSDKAKNAVTTTPYNFTVDTTPPTGSFASPVNNAFLNAANPQISLSYGDGSGSGVAPNSVHVYLQQGSNPAADITASLSVTATSASGQLSGLADGTYHLQAVFSDKAGNAAIAVTDVFVVDTVAPSYTLLAPAPGSNLPNALPKLDVVYADNAGGSGIDLSRLAISIDGKDFTSRFTAISATEAIGQLLAGDTLADGPHQVVVTVYDKAGNLAAQSPQSFFIDTKPPQVTITAPASGSWEGTGSVPFAASWSDPAPSSGIDPTSLHVLVDAVDETATLTISSSGVSGTLTVPSTGAVTVHSILVTIADNAGNAGSSTAGVSENPQAPVVVIVSPVSGFYTNQSSVVVSGTISDADPQITAQCVGAGSPVAATITPGSPAQFSCVVPLAGGKNNVAVTVPDSSGRSTSVSTAVTVDTVPPVVTYTLTPPANAAGWNNSDVTVTFNCTDADAGVATCPDPVKVSTEGANQSVNVTATDKAGNSQPVHVTLNIDKTPPVITGSANPPANAAGWNNASVTVTWHCSDSLSGVGSNCPPPQTINAEGANQIISQTVTDLAGNKSAIASVQLSVEKTGPSITYTVAPPANAAGWNNTPVTVNFACTATASAHVPAAIAPVPVATEGKGQQVSQTCTDPAGNTATTTATVNLDLTPPTLSGTLSPAPNAAGWNTSDVTVNWQCSDSLSGVPSCPQSSTVTQDGKGQSVTASATDIAGNTATSSVNVNLEKTAVPLISAQLLPAPNAAGWNNADVAVTFVCTAAVADIVSCTPPVNVATEGANQSVPGTATDAAGRTATTTATINLDKTVPVITASVTPAPNAAGWNNSNATVKYTCADSLSGVPNCPAAQVVSTEGKNQVITQTVTDLAGNVSVPASVQLNIDKTPPTITPVVTPAANGAGWNNTAVSVNWQCADSLSGIASCPPANTLSSEGANQTLTGTATDLAGNTSTASTVSISIDQTGPSIALNTPATLSPSSSGQVTAALSDSLSGIASVTLSMNGTSLGVFSAPPYQASFTVPATAQAGDTLTITAVAMDAAGNTTTASRSITVTANGVVAGQVLNDATGHPIANASVQVVGQPNQSAVTDSNGRYSLQVTGQQVFLKVTLPSDPNVTTPATETTVDRQVSVQNGQGTVPVDARLTTVATPVSAASDGSATLSANGIHVTLPAGSLPSGTPVHLTPLSGQGLPNLLPLGWAPVSAFDLRADSGTPNSATATFSKLPQGTVNLVSYNYSQHFWTMLAPSLTVNADGTLPAQPLSGPGTYALAMADAADSSGNPIPVPGIGQPLTGVNMVALDATAVTTGTLSLPALGPQGGTDAATFNVQSGVGLPSGTVIQAQVTETYKLANNTQISDTARSQDVVIYRAPNGNGTQMMGTLPITASHTFAPKDLLSGKIHVDVLAGREGVRGEVGGSDAAVVQDGDVTVAIAAGSLPRDTDISVSENDLPSFLPTSSLLTPVVDLTLDTTDLALGNAAQLSVANQNVAAGTNLVIAYVPRVNGVPYLTVVALAQSDGNKITSVPYPGLTGMVQPGEYVVFQVTQPLGFISGNLSANNSTVQGIVSTDGLPFVAFSSPIGNYIVAALPGTVHLSASVPNTALAGTASANAIAGQTTNASIALTGTVNSATVNPPNGSIGFATSGTIVITSPVALNPQSVTSANVQLFQGDVTANNPVAVRLQLNTAGTQLTVLPQQLLQAATKYTLQATGLADVNGGAVNVPVSAFTTAENTVPTTNADALTFSFPDQNGNVQITAPAGSFQPGTKIQIVDLNSGVVLTFTVASDGSVSSQIQATINDTMQITITDPLGGVQTFMKSQFVAADGSTAVGAAGGIVTGPGGIQMIIPEGALSKAATFKLDTFDSSYFPDHPSLTGATFAAGIKISSPNMPAVFNKEVKLAFPKPQDAPDGAFYYVYRRLTGNDGSANYETLDHAFVQGSGNSAQVVMASPPFAALQNGFGGYNISPGGVLAVQVAAAMFVEALWTFLPDAPGLALPGVVTGKVRRVQYISGQSDPVYNPMPGVLVEPEDLNLLHFGLGISQMDGTFTLFAPFFTGGTFNLKACDPDPKATPPSCITVPASAITVLDTNTFKDAQPLFKYYKNVAYANFNFPPLPVSAPTAPIAINLYRLDQNNLRVPAGGIITEGTTLVASLKSALVVSSINISGPNGQLSNQQFAAVAPDVPDNSTDPTVGNYRISPNVTLPQPGTYTITVNVQPPTGGTPFPVTKSFLVVAPGSSNNQNIPNQPPAVLTAQSSPQDGATGIAADTLLSITFSEPVKGIPGNIALQDRSCVSLPLDFVGIAPDGTVIPAVGANDIVTSVTIQPPFGLQYDMTYTLTVGQGITDTDASNGAPPDKHLAAPVVIHFTTFGPKSLGNSSDQFSSTRVVTINDNAFVAKEVDGATSLLADYDISDPTNPVEVPNTEQSIPGRAQDIAAETASQALVDLSNQTDSNGQPVNLTNLVAVATGAGPIPFPSNIWIYGLSGNTLQRVGGVSVTNSADLTGTILRMVVSKGLAYTSTSPLGIQVIDLHQAVQEYAALHNDPGAITQFAVSMITEGQGFGQDAIINTIPVASYNAAANQQIPATLFDLKTASYITPGSQGTSHPLVLATGTLPLVVADPQVPGAAAVLSTSPLSGSMGGISAGTALALASLNDPEAPAGSSLENIAVIVGRGQAPDPNQNGALSAAPVLAVADLTDVTNPVLLSIIRLPEIPTDVVMNGSTALVGTAANEILLINLNDPHKPVNAGTIAGGSTALGDRLAISDSGFLLSSSFNSTLGGLNIVTLGQAAVINSFDPQPIVVSAGKEAFTTTKISYSIVPPDNTISLKSGEVHVDAVGGSNVATLPATLNQGSGSVTWPAGTTIVPSQDYVATLHVQKDGVEIRPVPKRVPFWQLPIAIMTRDRVTRIQFALPGQGLITSNTPGASNQPVSKYTVNVYLNNSTNPAFTVNSGQISKAFANSDHWYDGLVDGNDLARSPWVTRKIDKVTGAPGVPGNFQIQAFEIGTVFYTYGNITVTIVDESTSKVVQTLKATVSNDGNWSQIVDTIAQKVNGGQTTLSDATYALLVQSGGLVYRAASELWDAEVGFFAGTLQGALAGFKDGAEGDVHMVGTIFDAAFHPVESAKALGQFLAKVLQALKQIDFKGIINNLFAGVSGVSWPSLDQVAMGASKLGYFLGYLIGFIIEQVVVTFIASVLTEGADLIVKALQSVKWIASLTEDALALLRVVGLWLEDIAKAALDLPFAKSSLAFLRESQTAITALAKKYVGSSTLFRAIGVMWETSASLASKTFGWLEQINKMSEAAATRFVGFLSSSGEDLSTKAMTRWLGEFPNASQGIKDGVESYSGFDKLTPGEADTLVSTASEFEGTTSSTAEQQFVSKYQNTAIGDQVPAVTNELRPVLGDTTYPDDVVTDVVRSNADPTIVAFDKDAVAEEANMEKNSYCPFKPLAALGVMFIGVAIPIGPCGKDAIEDFKNAVRTDDGGVRLSQGLAKLKALNDPELDAIIVRLAEAAKSDQKILNALARAISWPEADFSAEGTAKVLRAWDSMRDANGAYTEGIFNAAQDGFVSGASANVSQVGNRGTSAGAVDLAKRTAYEAYTMKYYLDNPGSLEQAIREYDELAGSNPGAAIPKLSSSADIEKFGKKYNLAPLNLPSGRSTIEADSALLDATYFDMKDSEDPVISQNQINALVEYMQTNKCPIPQAIFIAPVVTPSILQQVRNANAQLAQALRQILENPDAYIPDFIKVIKGPPMLQ